MTTFTVTTLDDVVGADGQRSLREAVNSAVDGDTIRFAANLEGGAPLVLTGGQLTLSHNVTIDGDWDNNGSEVTISGNDASRILEITGAATQVALRDLTLTRGSGYSRGGDQ
jgi:CSLREA domain-containing protein